MLNSSSNIDIEKAFFTDFLSVFDESLENVEYADKPDIRAVFEGRKIGIEVRGLYHEERKKEESFRKNVLETAQKNYEEDNSDRLEVCVCFRDNLIDKTVKEARNELLKLIKEHKQTQDLQITLSPEESQVFDTLYFFYIGENESPPKWRFSNATNVPMTCPQKIQSAIDEKEDKLKDYELFEEYWLFLWIDFMDVYGMDQEIHNVDYSLIKSKGFKRIFIYKTNFKKYIEI